MPTQLTLSEPAPLSLTSLLLNLALCAILSLAVSWHFKRFGRTLSNRSSLAHILPFIALITTLIISVVKSSLALSLGLVGALSIVRFRTPVKEPEELAYLFAAIAIGLGTGADQRLATVVAVPVILAILSCRALFVRKREAQNLYLNIEVSERAEGDGLFQRISDTLKQRVDVADVRRLDVRDGKVTGTFYIVCDDGKALTDTIDGLRSEFPSAAITFVDQSNYMAE